MCYFPLSDVSFLASLETVSGNMPKAPLASDVDLEPGSSVDKEKEEREEEGESALKSSCMLAPTVEDLLPLSLTSTYLWWLCVCVCCVLCTCDQ